MLKDQVLSDAVKNEFEWDPRIDAAHIGVSVEDGGVTLSGLVDSYAEKWAVVRAAERVYGIRAIADEIEVRVPDVHDDSDISEALQHALDDNIDVPDTVKAEVSDGTVTLRGEVDWQFQRREAQRMVLHTKGVVDVVNLITIRPRAGTADVEQRVIAALKRSAELDARSVWVSTENGTVRLHGHVHSFHERRAAEDAAFAAPGVSAVENEITIGP